MRRCEAFPFHRRQRVPGLPSISTRVRVCRAGFLWFSCITIGQKPPPSNGVFGPQVLASSREARGVSCAPLPAPRTPAQGSSCCYAFLPGPGKGWLSRAGCGHKGRRLLCTQGSALHDVGALRSFPSLSPPEGRPQPHLGRERSSQRGPAAEGSLLHRCDARPRFA